MLLTELPATREAYGVGPSSQFALRVHGPAGDYEVNLSSGKTTVGSSPRCNVRIEQPGVDPLGCLIVCAGGELTVRRWAAGTLLNGMPFDEASLAVGDHLSLGSVDLEVVSGCLTEQASVRTDAGLTEEPAAEQAPFSWGKETIHHTTVWIGEDEDETAQGGPVEAEPANRDEPAADATDVVPGDAAREVFRQLQTANANSRSRSRKLLAALRKDRDANRDLLARIDGLTNAKDELVAEFAGVARERAMLHDQLAAAEQRYSEFDHQSHEWDKLRREWYTARADWDRQRTEWTEQTGEWESRIAGYVRRIEELEAQLAEVRAEDSAAHPTNAESFLTPSSDVPTAKAESTEVAWPDFHSQPELLPAPEQVAANGELNGTAAWQTAEAEAPAWERERTAEPPVWERHTPAWETERPSWEVESPTPDNESPASNAAPAPAPPEDEELPEKPETDIAPAPVVASPKTNSGPVSTPIVVPPHAAEKSQPVSYIERFSHMFTDEEGPKPPAVEPAPQPAVDKAPAASDDEESIEEYMAKLLQRVRGDRPAVATPTPAAPTDRSTTANKTSPPVSAAPVATQTTPSETPTEPAAGEPGERLNEQVPDLSELVRKAPIISHPTNLKELRALANHTARQAIGVHATKEHRRHAVTKFIVASLAGMTSLWLMLLAPDWRDVQFIVACVSLLVAAYWAGQTYAALVEASRACDYDGPESDDEFDDLNPPLPT